MPSTLIEYLWMVLNAAGTQPVVVITSIRGGGNPYIKGPPKGDGASFNPLTGESLLGAYTVEIADWPVGSSKRVLTQYLEDPTALTQQLGYRKAFVGYRLNGGATTTAGSFAVGTVYTIASLGTTDFTLIGAASNTVGLTFVATGAGTGTGTATAWVALINGVLTLLRLTDAMTYESTVSDVMRTQLVSQLFSPASSVNIMDFLTTWPHRGCLAGGPVMNGVLGIRDLGGWLMWVDTEPLGIGYTLRPINVYGPPSWNTNDNISHIADAINQAAYPYQIPAVDYAQDSWTTIGDVFQHGCDWSGITVLVDSGSGPVPFKPYGFVNINPALIPSYQAGLPVPMSVLVGTGKGDTGIRIITDGTRTLTVGSHVRVRVLTILPTDQCPIYIAEHPIDALIALWNSAGIAYDSASTTALKNLIGTDAQIALRITEPKQLSDLVKTICLPFGIGIRGSPTGSLQVFDARLGRTNTVPTTTIADADVIASATRLPFELDPAQALQQINFSWKQFIDQRNVPVTVSSVSGSNTITVDSVVEQDMSLTVVNGDTSGVPAGVIDIQTDGYIQGASSLYPTIVAFLSAIAQQLFNRFGHGAQAAETVMLRGGQGDGTNLGDELLFDVSQLPNHNYRLGDNNAIAARAMQIVRRTERPDGYEVRLLDSGPNAQPYGTLPTVTVAGSSDLPRTVATVMITNAATLNAVPAGVRMQWAFTSGAAPSSSQYHDVMAFGAGAIPTGAIRLPSVTEGTTVYVRARTEAIPTARPSNYGSASGVTLSAVNDPSALSVVPSGSDATLATLSWTPGASTSTDVVDIYLRTSSQTFAQAVKLASLAAGSNTYLIEGLASGTAYKATVQYRDPRTQDVSDPIDVSFTSGSTTRTLTAPLYPFGFAGSIDPVTGAPIRDGTYGLAVVAQEMPGNVAFSEAVETSVGSGTYGAFGVVANVPSVSGNWTVCQRIAANDGLRRQLKARHTPIQGASATASSYTSTVTVTPWSIVVLPSVSALFAQGDGSVDSSGNVGFHIDGGALTASVSYAFSTSTYPSDATAAAGTNVNGRQIAVASLTTLTFGQICYVTAVSWSGANATGAQLPSVRLRLAYQSFSFSKTLSYTAAQWTSQSTPKPPGTSNSFAYQVDNGTDGAIYFVDTLLATWESNFVIAPTIPDGVTITQVLMDGYVDASIVDGNAAAVVTVARATGTTLTTLGVADTTAAGWASVTLSLSESTTGRSYTIYGTLVAPAAANAPSGKLRLGQLQLTYTMPTPDKAV